MDEFRKKRKEVALETINHQIAVLEKIRESIKNELNAGKSLVDDIRYRLSDNVIKTDWVIEKDTNTYYQFLSRNNVGVGITRHNATRAIEINDFNKNFRLAKAIEVKQHKAYLTSKGIKFLDTPLNITLKGESKTRNDMSLKTVFNDGLIKTDFDPMKCDFYMVTCTGQNGSKVRHPDYESAEKEAIRVAKLKEHQSWVVGVVATVKPVVGYHIEKK